MVVIIESTCHPVRSEDLQEHNQKHAPMSYKDKVAMLDTKMEKIRDGDEVELSHDDMKKLWGRLKTGLSSNQKALTLYKEVGQLPHGQHKDQKKQMILWAWPGAKPTRLSALVQLPMTLA